VEVAGFTVLRIASSRASPVVSRGVGVAVVIRTNKAARVHGNPKLRGVAVEVQLKVQPGLFQICWNVNGIEMVIVLGQLGYNGVSGVKSSDSRLRLDRSLNGVGNWQTVALVSVGVHTNVPVTSTEAAVRNVNVAAP